MKLLNRYEELFVDSLSSLRRGEPQIDPMLESPTDDRFGLSLIIRPSDQVIRKVEDFLSELQLQEPQQYFYPSSQIHITVLSIISCVEGFRLNDIHLPEYNRVIRESISQIGPFEMEFQGITASRSSILLQGFPQNDFLEHLRERLRRNFGNSGLRESMDARYKLSTAHATILRFKSPLKQPEAFVQSLQDNRNRKFGSDCVTSLMLVYNDWYHRQNSTLELEKFALKD